MEKLKDYVHRPAEEYLSFHQEDQGEVCVDQEVWADLLSVALAICPQIQRKKMDGWIDCP